MNREQLDLLIRYINLKVRLTEARNPHSVTKLTDELVVVLEKLERTTE